VASQVTRIWGNAGSWRVSGPPEISSAAATASIARRAMLRSAWPSGVWRADAAIIALLRFNARQPGERLGRGRRLRCRHGLNLDEKLRVKELRHLDKGDRGRRWRTYGCEEAIAGLSVGAEVIHVAQKDRQLH